MTNALLAALVVLTALNMVLDGAAKVLHYFWPKSKVTKEVDVIRADVAKAEGAVSKFVPPPKQAGRASVALLVVLALLGLAIAATGCGASAREKTLQATYASVKAAETGLDAFSPQHELDIVKAAPDKATGEAQLHAFEAKRDKVKGYIAAAYDAIASAVTFNNDPSVAAAVQAAAMVAQGIKDIGVKLP